MPEPALRGRGVRFEHSFGQPAAPARKGLPVSLDDSERPGENTGGTPFAQNSEHKHDVAVRRWWCACTIFQRGTLPA